MIIIDIVYSLSCQNKDTIFHKLIFDEMSFINLNKIFEWYSELIIIAA